MIREICTDEFFLSQKAAPATADDLDAAQDLLDTLDAHQIERATFIGHSMGGKAVMALTALAPARPSA